MLDTKTRYVLKGIGLTVLSGIFAVLGLVVAATQNFFGGVLIVAGSSIFWGYACLLSSIAKLRLKRSRS
jgi:hypothetical protein